jgi:hypothetical protein
VLLELLACRVNQLLDSWVGIKSAANQTASGSGSTRSHWNAPGSASNLQPIKQRVDEIKHTAICMHLGQHHAGLKPAASEWVRIKHTANCMYLDQRQTCSDLPAGGSGSVGHTPVNSSGSIRQP